MTYLLHNGTPIPVREEKETYHITIDGLNFCSETKSGLRKVIHAVFPIVEVSAELFNRYGVPDSKTSKQILNGVKADIQSTGILALEGEFDDSTK